VQIWLLAQNAIMYGVKNVLLTKGKGHYPKQRASNVCPYCGSRNTVKSAR